MFVVPARQSARHVRENRADEIASRVARFPDPPLQLLESRGLAIAIHEPGDVGRKALDRGLRRAGPLRHARVRSAVCLMLGAKSGPQRFVRRRGEVPFQILTEAAAGVRKEHLGDERNRCGRAFDVEEHRPDRAVRGRVVHSRAGPLGTYDNPKHTGWKPASTPESV